MLYREATITQEVSQSGAIKYRITFGRYAATYDDIGDLIDEENNNPYVNSSAEGQYKLRLACGWIVDLDTNR